MCQPLVTVESEELRSLSPSQLLVQLFLMTSSQILMLEMLCVRISYPFSQYSWLK
jgi:hypothetical protein